MRGRPPCHSAVPEKNLEQFATDLSEAVAGGSQKAVQCLAAIRSTNVPVHCAACVVSEAATGVGWSYSEKRYFAAW